MKRFLSVMLIVLGMSGQARAYIDSTPTLGKLIADSNNVVVLRVEKVSRDKQAVIYTKVADLKGKDWPEVVKHKLTDGFHPRHARAILDWAEPGAVAVCFRGGNVCQTCIGGFWYETAAAAEAPWWTMTGGRPELSYTYRGSTAKLRDHVTAILGDKEVVVTALKFAAFDPGQGARKTSSEGWATYEAVGSGRLMRGKDWPVWRIKASLKAPAITMHLVMDSLKGESKFIVGDGPGGADDVPALVKALKHEDAHVRREAAEDLGQIGAPAADAVPPLLQLAEKDPDPLTRVAAAKAVAGIDPKNETAVPALVEALKDKTANVRKRAAESLGDLGPGARSVVPALTKTVKDPDPLVSWASIDALGQIGPEAEAAVPTLVEALKVGNTRAAAVDALGLIGQKAQAAIPALEEVLKGDDVSVRWATAAALVRVGGSGAKAGVQYFLKAATPNGGKELYDAENLLVAPAAKDARREMLDAVREPTLRDTAVRIFRDKNFVPLTKEQLADAKKFLKDSDAGVRCVAVWVVHCARRQAGENVDYKEDFVAFQEALKAEDPWARLQAARFLGHFGPYAKDAVPALSAALEDKDEGVRKAVAEALNSIRSK
jgi:HEAT repeat protein